MRFFTHYWERRTFSDSHRTAGSTVGDELLHIAGNQFKRRNVMPEDRVYVISYRNGKLHVVGRLTVGRIVTQAKAEAILGPDLWEASEHIITQKGGASPMRFDRSMDQQAMREIEFIRPDGSLAEPAMKSNGAIDPQTFRGVREITLPTASAFDTQLGLAGARRTP